MTFGQQFTELHVKSKRLRDINLLPAIAPLYLHACLQWDVLMNILYSPFRSSKEDWCRTRLQWYCWAEFGTSPFVLFPNSAPQCRRRRVRHQCFYELRKGELPDWFIRSIIRTKLVRQAILIPGTKNECEKN